MTVYADKERPGKWICERQINGKRKRKRFNSRQEALDFQASGGAFEPQVRGPRTIRDAIQILEPRLWRGMRWEKHARPHLAFAERVIGDVRLEDFRGEHVRQVVDGLHAKGVSPATWNRYLASLHRFLVECQEYGYIQVVPKFPRRLKEPPRERYLDRREEARIIELLHEWERPDEVDLVVVGVDTGMRLGEIRAMVPRDLKFPLGSPLPDRVSIPRSMTGKPRTVFLTPRAAQVLARRARGRAPMEPLFPAPESTIRYWWDRARDAMGLKDDQDFSFKALRHTCLTRLAGRAHPRVVQKWAGYATLASTDRYTRVEDANLRRAAEVLASAAA